MVVEALLIVSVAPLDLAVVPRCSRTNKLVFNLVAVTKHIKWMNTLGIEEVSKFCTIIRLNGFGGLDNPVIVHNCSVSLLYSMLLA